MNPYLVIDPTDDYPARIVRFLQGRGLDAVALFSSPAQAGLWERRWRAELGGRVVAEHVVDREHVGALAERLRAEFPGGFSGIVPWDERTVLLGAELGEALDLGWNPARVIERFRDKFVLKAHLREHGTVRVNRSATVTDAGQAVAFARTLDAWPVVVKPTGGAGSMSVHFADDVGSLLAACQEVLERGLGEVLLEEYVGGVEHVVNGIVDARGEVLVTEVWRYDKRDSHGEKNLYFETIKVSTHEAPFAEAAAYAREVLRTLGLRRAPFHMELKVDERGPCLIECGARFAGGHQPVLGSRLHHHDLFELAACHYLAELDVSEDDVDFDHYDRHAARVVSGVQTHEVECVREVLGVEEVERLPSFVGMGMLRKVGQRVPVSRDVGSKAWEVYLFHPDAAQVARDAVAARALLRYVG